MPEDVTLDTYNPKPRRTAKAYIETNLERIQTALRKTSAPNWEEVHALVLAEEDAPQKLTLSSFITYFYQAGGSIKKPRATSPKTVTSLPTPKR